MEPDAIDVPAFHDDHFTRWSTMVLADTTGRDASNGSVKPELRGFINRITSYLDPIVDSGVRAAADLAEQAHLAR